jgi:DNA invertase Pin-like site-specific DNA recombinase
MRKFAAYYRVSKDSHESGKSKSKQLGLDAQTNIVRHFFKDDVIAEFTEVKSAKNITDRPVLQETLDYCLKNNCWLVVAKLDRMSRNVDDVRAIVKQLNRKVVFCDIPSEGEADMMMVTMYAAFAERERELISLRTKQALKVKMERDGKWQKGSSDMDNLRKLAVKATTEKAMSNENSIRASELVIDKRIAGWSYIKIAELLNTKKFSTPKDGLFYPQSVKRIFEKYSHIAVL